MPVGVKSPNLWVRTHFNVNAAYLAILSVFFWHLFLISQGALQLKRRNAKDQQMWDTRQAVELTWTRCDKGKQLQVTVHQHQHQLQVPVLPFSWVDWLCLAFLTFHWEIHHVRTHLLLVLNFLYLSAWELGLAWELRRESRDTRESKIVYWFSGSL